MLESPDKELTFDDVTLQEGKTIVESRKDVDLKTDITEKLSLDIPVVSSAMDSVTSFEMAKAMGELGACCIHHKYQSFREKIKLLKKFDVEDISGLQGVSVGYNTTPKEVKKLVEAGADVINLDLAHGWADKTKEWLETLPDEVLESEEVAIMIGSFGGIKGAKWIKKEIRDKIDLVRFSQGGGSVCTTRIKTGVGKPTWQAVHDVDKKVKMMPKSNNKGYKGYAHPKYEREDIFHVVADGGLRYPGDLAKAIGAGATVCQLGSMLAGCKETPGKTKLIKEDGKTKEVKEYRGMASEKAKKEGDVDTNFVEGVSTYVDYKGPVKSVLGEIKDGLQSAVATCGFDNVEEFRGDANFYVISQAAQRESRAHQLFD